MNQSLNLQQSNDLHWTSSENWEQQQASAGSLVALEQHRHHYYQQQQQQQQQQQHQHHQQQQQQQQSSRADWDWDSPTMLLGSSSAADKLPSFMKSTAGAGNGLLQAQFFQQQQQQQPQPQVPLGVIFGGAFHPGYGGAAGAGAGAGEGIVGPSSLQQQQTLPFSTIGGGVGPAVSAASSYGDLRSFEHRRRLYGLLEMEPARLCDLVKQEDLYAEAQARIGLNLGVRTYFSTEDTLARLGKRPRANSPGAQVPLCQAEGCKADLSAAKHYHRRHKVCELHSKAATVTANGQTQRFCQQCSRFHLLSEFDEGKRSCRKRLADHNRRRRKPQQPVAAVAPAAGAAAGAVTKEDGESGEGEQQENNGTMADDKPMPASTATSSDNSKTGSAESSGCRFKASCNATSNKMPTTTTTSSDTGRGGAHSTLLGDGPTSKQQGLLINPLSPSPASLTTPKADSSQQADEYASLSLSSLQTTAVPWLKSPEPATVQHHERSSTLTSSPMQSLLSIASSEWAFQEQQSQSRSYEQQSRSMSNSQRQHQQQVLAGLLENPLAATQQARTRPLEFFSQQQTSSLSSEASDGTKLQQALKPFGSSMFQSM